MQVIALIASVRTHIYQSATTLNHGQVKQIALKMSPRIHMDVILTCTTHLNIAADQAAALPTQNNTQHIANTALE